MKNLNLIKPLMFSIIAVVAALGLVFAAGSLMGAQAQSPAELACEGAALAGGTGDCTNTDAAKSELGGVASTIVDILSIIVGTVSVIMIIIGGLRYITSAGDAQRAAGAKNTILYAVVGLVIVIFAQVIVNFVIGEVSPTTP